MRRRAERADSFRKLLGRNRVVRAMTREELQRVRDWADQKIVQGEEPPWTWFQYMKLRETLDQLLEGMSTKPQTESSPEQAPLVGSGPRLAVSNVRPSSAQPHQQVVPVRLPT